MIIKELFLKYQRLDCRVTLDSSNNIRIFLVSDNTEGTQNLTEKDKAKLMTKLRDAPLLKQEPFNVELIHSCAHQWGSLLMERIMIVPRNPSQTFTELDRDKIAVFFKQYYRLVAMPIKYRDIQDSFAVNREDFPKDRSNSEIVEELSDNIAAKLELSAPHQVMYSDLLAISHGIVRGTGKLSGHMDQIPRVTHTGNEAFDAMKKAMIEHPENVITLDSCSQATSAENWLTYDEISEETKAEISNVLKKK